VIRPPVLRGDASWQWATAAAAGLGLLLWSVGAWLHPRQAFFSYLAAYTFTVSVALGSLLLLMTLHVVGARWFVALRRVTETAALTLPLLAVLFLPLFLGLDALFPWVSPEALAPEARALVLRRRPYLNVPWFALRAGGYFVLWSAVALLLARWSLRQDRTGDGAMTRRQRVLSVAALPAVGFALTFASFDWLMSLSVEWSSSIWGLYYFAGGFVAAVGMLALLAFLLERGGALRPYLRPSHYYALGSLLLASVALWAYVAYSQYLIVWIADLPREVAWYHPRVTTSWRWVALTLVAGHVALPVLLLLSWRLKRRSALMASVGAWILAMHYLDVYWIVLPALHPEGLRPHWLDLAALVGVAASAAALGIWRLRTHPVVPLGDPLLEASQGYATRGVTGPPRVGGEERDDG
jgi:hypothetical protein